MATDGDWVTGRRRRRRSRSCVTPSSTHQRVCDLVLLVLFLSVTVTQCLCDSLSSTSREFNETPAIFPSPDPDPDIRSSCHPPDVQSRSLSSKCDPDLPHGDLNRLSRDMKDGSPTHQLRKHKDNLRGGEEGERTDSEEERNERKRNGPGDGSKDRSEVVVEEEEEEEEEEGLSISGSREDQQLAIPGSGRKLASPARREAMASRNVSSGDVNGSRTGAGIPWTMERTCGAFRLGENRRGSEGASALRARANSAELKPSPLIIVASFLSVIGGALANVGGVGGGGLFVPMFNLLLGFDAKTAVPLSKSMILGGSIVSFLYNKQVRHPVFKDRSVIDYDAAVLLQPMLLLGISTGVLCNIIFPSWLIVLLLTVLLTYISLRTFRNGVKMWRKETNASEMMTQKQDAGKVYKTTLIVGDVESAVQNGLEGTVKGHNNEDANGVEHAVDRPDDDTANTSLLPPSPSAVEDVLPEIQFPWKNIWILAVFWILFLVIQISKSGMICVGNDYLVMPCGKGYWVLTASQVPLALVLTFLAIYMLSDHEYELLQSSGSTSQEGKDGDEASNEATKMQHTREPHTILGPRQFFMFPIFSLLAGIMGGLLGVGGGMIISPMMLELGYDPKVTTSTSMFMVLFASSMSVAEYALLGRIPLDFGLYFAILCAIAAWLGNAALSKAIKRWGRVSIIIFITALVIFCSSMIMGVFGSLEVMDMYKAGDYMGFHDVCDA